MRVCQSCIDENGTLLCGKSFDRVPCTGIETCGRYHNPSAESMADKIRAMSDEELAEWLTEFADEAFSAGVIGFGGALMTEQDRLSWLQQPAAGWKWEENS